MNTEKHAAEVLLDRGVSWPLLAPWYMRIVGKKTVMITVKALRLGTLLELSRLYAESGMKAADLEKDPLELIGKHMKPVCLIVAVCILNSKIRIRLFSRPLARFILKRFTANMLLEVMVFIATFSGYASFLNTIRLIGDMKITTPKNLSPEEQGSQQKL
jgi:hypothetical protein